MIKNFEKSNIDLSKNTNLYLDSTIAPSALNEDFFEDINCLAPFGSGNSEPRFVIENIKVISTSVVGNDHIKSILGGKDGSIFNGNDRSTDTGSFYFVEKINLPFPKKEINKDVTDKIIKIK